MEFLIVAVVGFLALFGTPLFIIMAMAAMVGFHFSDIPLVAVAIEVNKLSSQASILTIPLFTFAGYMMAESGSPRRLLRFAEASLGLSLIHI